MLRTNIDIVRTYSQRILYFLGGVAFLRLAIFFLFGIVMLMTYKYGGGIGLIYAGVSFYILVGIVGMTLIPKLEDVNTKEILSKYISWFKRQK